MKAMMTDNADTVHVTGRGNAMIEKTIPAYFTAWQDNKPVHLLSSFPTNRSTVRRRVEVNGIWTNVLIAIPSIIKIHNWFMGGTDSLDQRLSYYRSNIKTKSWVPKLLIHFLNISVVNSYILYKQYFNKPKKYSLLMFTRELIDNLAKPWLLQMRAAELDSTRPNLSCWKTKNSWSTNWMMRLTGVHNYRCHNSGQPDPWGCRETPMSWQMSHHVHKKCCNILCYL